MKLLQSHWFYVVSAFLILLIAWGSLITIASKHRAETIPLNPSHTAR
ncbi:MAG: hypothetical protein P1U89_07615 [Verrucomicrobiales bacterium]|nr:hypothetical protein [Verrucomicrobiales bacterium]